MLHYRQQCLECCVQRLTWIHERHDVVFSDELRLCLLHHDSRIPVRWHRGERMLEKCIRHHHTGPSPGMMVSHAIGCKSRSPLVRIHGMSNGRYISLMLMPVVPPFIQALRNAMFQEDNA